MLSVLIWLPLGIALLALLLPARAAGWGATVATAVSLGLAIALLAGYDTGTGGLQYAIDESWIPDLGVRYSLGVDGISLFLVLLTAVSWFAVTLWSAIHTPERARTWFGMLALAQAAVMGAFLAQDLLLFVLFFDLMLVPFYFLFAAWGEGADRTEATLKMMIFTLIGSLLMLVGAIATGIFAGSGGSPEFSMAALAADPLAEGTQRWIFWFFAAAFLVKMPAFGLHGWMRDAYRVAPLPALALFSGVLSKVAAYGFIRVALPIFPDATAQFQEVLLLGALASVLYGSIMAFSQTSARLIAGYSSIAQLGFITLGIFALRPDGLDGAVLQMVNHGLVVLPVLLIFAAIAERQGSDDITRLGGLAQRAPVLAALFMVVTMALLAIPGSANFVAEFFILNAVFQEKAAIAIVATLGIAMAAFYALRMFQGAMHNRVLAGRESHELTAGQGLILGALVACIVALALYPQIVLERTDKTVSIEVHEK